MYLIIKIISREGFCGISSIPEFYGAIHQSLANQHYITIFFAKSVTIMCSGSCSSPSPCPTCALISEGSTCQSDNTCPQCGKDTTSL